MVSILKPFSRILAPGGLQLPSDAVQIDWLHPLAFGLYGCWLPGTTGPIDLTQNNQPQVITSAGYPVINDGPALGFTANGATMTGTASSVYTSWTGATIFWRGVALDTTFVGFPTLFGVTYDNAGSSPFSVISAHRRNGANTIRGQSNRGGGITVDAGDTAMSLNVLHSVAVTVTNVASTVTVTLYIDGVQTNTANGAGAVTSTATSQVALGYDLTGAIATNQSVGHADINTAMAAFWTRALSADEINSISNAPYQFFAPAEYELEILPGLAGAVLVFSQQTITIPLLMTVPITVTAHG